MSVTRNAIMNWLIDKIPPRGFIPPTPPPDGAFRPNTAASRPNLSSRDSDHQTPPLASSQHSSRPSEAGAGIPPRALSSNGPKRSSASHQQELSTLQSGRQNRRLDPESKPAKAAKKDIPATPK